jgi:hypothetical protein
VPLAEVDVSPGVYYKLNLTAHARDCHDGSSLLYSMEPCSLVRAKTALGVAVII